MGTKELLLKCARECYVRLFGYPKDRAVDNSRVQYFDAEGNDFMYRRVGQSLEQGRGLAACKFGSIELANVVASLMEGKWRMADEWALVKGYPVPMFRYKEVRRLGTNAGFFPLTEDMVNRFVELMLRDIADVDILASYVYGERYIASLLSHCATVNLDGFYAPVLYEHPWTRVLAGKRVLVVHPFAESIKAQYARRVLLFDNPEVLPEFKSLRVVKAVQSIAGNDCGFSDWFAALDYMKAEMEKVDFDVALIGCGAYGFPLTVHAKRLGKVGIHLAGWTQMLFGIYGKRWLTDQPQYARFINPHWVRPGGSEVPAGVAKVEGGCYW